MNQTLEHLKNRTAILWSYLAGKTVVAGGPKYVLLEATGKCNLFCPMCPRELVHFEPVDIPMPLFKKIIDEAKGFLEFAVPYGGGEPMLNPAIFEMIKFCRDRNIRVGFSTNGTMEQSRTQPQTSRRGFGLPDIRFRRSHQGELQKISQRREVRRNA